MKQTLLRNTLSTLPLFLFLLLGPSQLLAQYNSFGSASCDGACCQLTDDVSGQAGSIFSSSPIDLTQPFGISCSLNFGPKDAQGADGFIFILAETPGLGNGGGGIGYENLPGASIGIEIDDYQNGGYGDPAADHMAIISQGNMSHTGGTSLVPPITIPNVEDGGYHCFNVNWNPATNTLSATLDGNSISYVGNIAALVGGSK